MSDQEIAFIVLAGGLRSRKIKLNMIMAKEEEYKSLEQRHKESLQRFYTNHAMNTGMSAMLEAMTGHKIRTQDVQVQVWIPNEKGRKPSRRQKVIATYLNNDRTTDVKGFTYMDVQIDKNGEWRDVWISEYEGFYNDAAILAWMPNPEAYEPPE